MAAFRNASSQLQYAIKPWELDGLHGSGQLEWVSLFRLLYASTARSLLPPEELLAILKTSKEHNALYGITGLLYHGNGAFLQVLEGDRAAVSSLYNRITQDPRNRDCELLHCGAIGTRRFADWSMRLAGFSGAQRSQLLLRSGLGCFEPLLMTTAQATDFLSALAESERESGSLKSAS